ncbi:mitochondrial K+-H+ exchange-related-domain-containing protein [Hysterangium stoloniferum]|nr:mitochondrial K+-H+ exchange-related-domain-containing protein [Hysterangium stoloniferum]
MRIIALPLTTARVAAGPKSQSLRAAFPLTYYHFHVPPANKDKPPTLFKRSINKATELWGGFGKAPEGNWKRRIFVYGEYLINRIDFEEYSLKGLDPSLGPRIGQLRRENPEKDPGLVQVSIPLFFPSAVYAAHGLLSPMSHMQLLLAKRGPQHRRGFYTWLLIAPLTTPFALIPIIPNLPFFYAVWRAWSHYRVWKASVYMQRLIESKHVILQPSPALDEAYASYAPSLSPGSEANTDVPPLEVGTHSTGHSSELHSPRLLLSSDGIPKVIETFKLESSAQDDMVRAIQQAEGRIEKS